jgi:hypothetical protein
VSEPNIIYLSEDGFAHVMELTSGPPTPVPALVELFKRRAPWETPTVQAQGQPQPSEADEKAAIEG